MLALVIPSDSNFDEVNNVKLRLSERRAMLALVIPSDSNFDEVNNAKVQKSVYKLSTNVKFLEVA